MEDFDVFTTLNHSGSFGKNFVNFFKKIDMLFTGLGSVRMVKNLFMLSLRSVLFHPERECDFSVF